MSYNELDDHLSRKFVCPKCEERGAHVERLAMAGTGVSRFFEVQRYRYAFASCKNCGYTEVFNLNVIEGEDKLGTILEILTAD